MNIDEAISDFLGQVRATQTAGTAKTYATGLGHFRRYLLSQAMPPERTEVVELSLRVAIRYLPWLFEYLVHETAGGDPQRVSDRTKATYLAALSRFFEYLIVEAQELSLTLDDYDKLRKEIARTSKYTVRDELPPDKLPSQEIVQALIEEAHRPPALPADLATTGEIRRRELAHLRNLALIEALLSSGMRVSELVRLRRGDLLYDIQGAILKYTKGKKEREVLFSESAWNALMEYLQARKDGGERRPLTDLPVFARHDRRAGSKVLPISTRSVQSLFVALAKRADIAEKFHLTPHTLRHFFATEFLSQTGNLALTQYALGHASPTTTRIYAQTKRQDYRRAHQEVFGTRGEER